MQNKLELLVYIRHLIGLEPINGCFEGKCFTNSAKDVIKSLIPNTNIFRDYLIITLLDLK